MDGNPPVKKRIGYWMTEKKIKRLNFEKFESVCRISGIDIVKLNFDEPLDKQGPFDVILHKVTDQLSRTQDGGSNAFRQIQLLQQYMDDHPEVIIIDPIENVFRLLDRHKQYQYVKECDSVESNYHYFIPSFAEFCTSDVELNKRLMEENDIHYPIVCKPSMSHCNSSGSTIFPNIISDREEMAIVFNEEGLSNVEVPCVAQTFVNHNARLYKIFIIGSKYYIIQRPSIKNFYADSNQLNIFFNSSDVSKSYSSSELNKLDESEVDEHPLIDPDPKKLDNLVSCIQKKFGLDLLGIDVIIENDTGRYAVIDINAFPGFDGVDEFFPALLELITNKLDLSERLKSKDSTSNHAGPEIGSHPDRHDLLKENVPKATNRSDYVENNRTVDEGNDGMVICNSGLESPKKRCLYNGLCTNFVSPLKGSASNNICTRNIYMQL